MRVDVGNALATVATPGISREALARLDERVARAHRRIAEGRRDGTRGYVALDLPERVDPATIRAVTDELPAPSSIILVGIGGSALGAATVSAALPSDVDLHVLDHLDAPTIEGVLAETDLEDTVLHVVSRSGKTTETVANASIVRQAMRDAGVDWTARTMVTTGSDGPLRAMAERHDLPVLDPPNGVPGRYSVLSTMGLPTLALQGHDIEALLAGGRATVDTLSDSLFETPAYAFGATSYALAVRGATVNALMPYAEGLETLAEWFAQLWAESLGKDGLGQVPTRALGVTDQHSQLQLYRAGPRAVQVSFLVVDEPGGELSIPENSLAEEASVATEAVDEIAATEFRSTEASLAAAGRPSVRITIPSIDERSLGELLVGMEAACMMAAELFGVDAFDQPAVEWGKRATRAALRGESAPERTALEDKVTLEIPED